jgi:alkyl sulfatase BDS1-like metallo-beta-lactamase superfamily hydrolase
MKKKGIVRALGVFSLAALLAACADKEAPLAREADADEYGSAPATQITARLNDQVLQQLPFADQQDFEDARRGLIASVEGLQIPGRDGRLAWDQASYEFITGEAPPTVNPSLWRQAQLNNIHGLFKVTEGIYQLRGFDLANITIIEGETGWIIVDPLTTRETASKALSFAYEQLGRHPIEAIIFTHSHIDHFGGALGILSVGQIEAEAVRVIAPIGFMDESISENLLAGPTMIRRSEYMYGLPLPKTARGHVDTGLGKAPADGTVGILAPTDIIDHTGQELNIDGLPFVFQNVSGSEAPAELTFYLPQHKAYCGAELLSRNMHNLYTLRGAKVRDALAWSDFIIESGSLFPEAEIYFASHHWPIWGRQRIADFMQVQADTYKYIHDQTLRLAYHGYTPGEIAEQLELPPSLRKTFSNRGYYGTLRHNSRAVYQGYFGWYDGNPANLNPLPPEQAGANYVAAMGGADNVMKVAQASYDRGDYRWVGQLLNHLVFAQPEHRDARALLARAYEQLGYQAESGPWRDVYLTGAFELRNGKAAVGRDIAAGRDMVRHSPRSNFFNVMAAQLNGPDAHGIEMIINFTFTDLDETHVLSLKNSVLRHRRGEPDPDANATLNITHELFLDLALGSASAKDLIFSDQLSIEGSKIDLARFFALQDKVAANFSIVTP